MRRAKSGADEIRGRPSAAGTCPHSTGRTEGCPYGGSGWLGRVHDPDGVGSEPRRLPCDAHDGTRRSHGRPGRQRGNRHSGTLDHRIRPRAHGAGRTRRPPTRSSGAAARPGPRGASPICDQCAPSVQTSRSPPGRPQNQGRTTSSGCTVPRGDGRRRKNRRGPPRRSISSPTRLRGSSNSSWTPRIPTPTTPSACRCRTARRSAIAAPLTSTLNGSYIFDMFLSVFSIHEREPLFLVRVPVAEQVDAAAPTIDTHWPWRSKALVRPRSRTDPCRSPKGPRLGVELGRDALARLHKHASFPDRREPAPDA